MPTPKQDLFNSAPKLINSEKIMHVPGSVIGGRYQIIQKLGREETGKTYLAKDLQATGDSRCAIERLNPSYDNEINWQLIKKHLIDEIDVLERLGDHPQIPQFYNYFIEERQFYLVREYINGDNLQTVIERKLFDEADTVYLIQDALRILDFIHKTNVIHGNVQPIHLIRRKQDGKFVLINFGAIREIESTEINFKGELTGGKPIGNWAYIAPEQKAGQSHFKSDIYALGKAAVYALTGRSPLELEQAKIRWQTLCQISFTLEKILTRMMSLDLEERYSSALDVLQDLKPLLKIKQIVGGRYAITRYLGGTEGVETYLADNLHRQYQSPCSIKQIELPSVHGAGKIEIERRFAEELSILERLGYHEQIPQVWDHFEENDEFYLVQEYIQGDNLAYRIEQQDLLLPELVGILTSALSVLSFIHQNRIIHRNLKPDNLMVRYGDRQVVITDFGILMDIKNLSYATSQVTQQNDKKNYWAPEQIAGRPTISSDLYALGMIAVEALTGVKPSTLQRNKQTGKLLWQPNFAVDRRLIKIINKTIDLDLGKRYQSADRILSDLQKVNLSGGSIGQSQKLSRIRDRAGSAKSKTKIFVIVGLLGFICLLGSIEFAFPTVRPIYYWYQGERTLAKKPQVALNTFTKAIDLKPESALGWSGRGDALYRLERYAEALEAYSEAARLDPKNRQNWLKQGHILYHLEQYKNAIAMYDRVFALKKVNAELYNYRGKALYELQDYRSALTMQEEALAIDRLNAKFLSDRAKNLVALNRYYDALTVLNRVQIAEPYQMKLWQDKSLVLKALNRPQEAARVDREIINHYNKVLAKQPRNPELWLAKGDFFADRQMYDRAIASYDRAIENKDNFYQAILAKGKALGKVGRDREALETFDRALEIRPKSYLAWQGKGRVYQNNQNDYTRAISSYNRGITLNSNYAPLWRDRGLAFIEQRNYNRAIESLSKASRIAPQDPQTWIGLATAWNNTGRNKQSLSAINRALELQPQNMEIWSLKGSILTQNAQYNEACDTYRQSRLVDPNSTMIIDSMKSIGCRMN